MKNHKKMLAWFALFLFVLFALPGLACSFGDEEDEATATPEVSLTAITKTVIVDFDGAPLRNGPGVDFDQIGVVSEEKQLEVLAISSDGNWYQVKPPESLQTVNPNWQVWISVLYTAEIAPPGFPLMGTQPSP